MMGTTKTNSPEHETAAKPKPNAATATPTVARAKLTGLETPKGAPEEPKKPVSKQNRLVALLVRDEGATLDQMIAATGWQPHTVRAALTGLKKKGYALSSDKIGGIRTYRAVGPE